MENYEQLSQQVRLGIKPGSSDLPVLSTALPLVGPKMIGLILCII